MGEIIDKVEGAIITVREWVDVTRVVMTSERAIEIARMAALGIQKDQWVDPVPDNVIQFPTTYEGTERKSSSGTLD